MESNYLLIMNGISKSFPGVKALDKVKFDLNAGEVHALLGENGAGKSTLIKILAGIHPMDEGEIILGGNRVVISSVADARKAGIVVIHQEISLVPKLSVADNIMLGIEGKELFLNKKLRKDMAKKAMLSLGFDIDVDVNVENLSIAQQQIVEIVRALSIDRAKVIVMDEPTASISERDANKLFETITSLSKKGVGIIYISHRMEEVMSLANRITVFRDGCYVGTKNVEETSLQQIVEMMVGRQIKKLFHYNIEKTGEIILEMKNISNKNLFNVNFDLRRGEVHGLYGLIGSGRTELMKTLFGLDAYNGEILFHNRGIKIRSPRDAMKLGIALAPEDRKLEGLFLSNTIKFNSMITTLNLFMKKCLIDHKKESEVLREYQGKLKIKYTSVSQVVSSLSGGNQQKIVLSKWLATRPDVLILDEPTRGIDVGAKSEIYDLIFRLIGEGVSIILISSELPEIINLCTRVSIMREGSLVGTIDRNEFKQEVIFEYAMQ